VGGLGDQHDHGHQPGRAGLIHRASGSAPTAA
jgi:hypothetical protein